MGRKSGLITLRTDLTEDYSTDYTLTIAAYDGGTPPYRFEYFPLFSEISYLKGLHNWASSRKGFLENFGKNDY